MPEVTVFIAFLQVNADLGFLPTAEGVTLSLQKFYQLNALLTRVVKEGHIPCTTVQTHIGGFYHAHLTPCGSIMTVKKRDPEHLLSQTDFVMLSRDEFEALFELYPRIQAIVPQLKSMYPCYFDHENQEAYFTCPECHPELDYPMD